MAIPKIQRMTFWFGMVTLLIVLTDTISVRTFSIAEEDPVLVYAVMFDFMLVIPFLYWLLVLRKQGKSVSKIMALPLLGALAVWLVVPASLRDTVWSAVWPIELVLIAAELAFLGYEIRLVYRLVRSFRKASREEPDTVEAMRSAVRSGVGQGRLASYVLHDLNLAYYLLFSWRRNKHRDRSETRSFSYHKQSNQVLYSAIITKVICLEGIAVHLMLQQWSHWAAWIFTIADLWLLALIWGDCRASILQPLSFKGDTLRIRYGLRIQADVSLDLIANVTSVREYQPSAQEQKLAAMPIIGTPNIRIELKKTILVEGLLFQPKAVNTIYLALDEPEAFSQTIETAIAVEINNNRLTEEGE